jgi:low affinity Fe/Cu permease
MKEWFHRFSAATSTVVGHPLAFFIALSVVLVWGILGPVFNFSQSWQLFINSTTTIVTVLMVFLIQNTQNRDAKAMHLKLDELIRASKSARDSFIDLEDISDEELSALERDFKKLHDEQASIVAHKLHAKLHAERTRRTSNQI